MKPCNNCGNLKPDEEYATDRTREDGLALICRACNKEKCKQWYRENRARAIARSQEYKAVHGRAPVGRGEPVRRDRSAAKQRIVEEAATEYQLVRFTPTEWRFCLQAGAKLGLKPDLYVRNLVRDARRAAVYDVGGE